jgi:2-polyprenyl-3-methyl-5-hydroxy-6-metoxy-1,4-benzoquinol methylase
MKNLLRRLLWKIVKRDFIALNPDWRVINRGRDFGLVGKDALVARRFLPVTYPFHIDPEWHIHYELRGEGAGLLRFTLATPDGNPICNIEQQVILPFDLHIKRESDRILANDKPLVTGAPPSDTTWLHGNFEFVADSGRTLIRHTAHRVRRDAGTEEGYFQDGAYADYENDPGMGPDAILNAIEKQHPITGRFLDAGCATGLLVEAAQRRGLEADGVDFSKWAVEKANARTGGRCRELDLDSAEASDFQGLYDIIVMHSVLEHLAEPERALQLLFDLTQPGGVVFIQTLNADSLMHRLLKTEWAGFSDYTHKSPWISAGWLESASQGVGFETVSISRHGVWLEQERDEVWRGFAELVLMYPANVLLAQEFGDFVEILLRKPQ